MRASLKGRSCCRAISRTMSTIQASPASDPDVPAEPTVRGIPALRARVIMISVSRLTAAAENMQTPVASGPGPGSVLPASQPIGHRRSESRKHDEPALAHRESKNSLEHRSVLGQGLHQLRLEQKRISHGDYF